MKDRQKLQNSTFIEPPAVSDFHHNKITKWEMENIFIKLIVRMRDRFSIGIGKFLPNIQQNRAK